MRGATRGNGETGEDVTANVFTIGDLPTRLRGKRDPRHARGARRGVHVARGVHRTERAPGRAGGAALRQPAQRGGRARCARSIRRSLRAATSRSSATSPARSTAVRSSRSITTRSTGSRELGFPVNPHIERLADLDAVHAFCVRMEERSSLARLRDRRRGGEGRLARAARRDGQHQPRAAVGDRVQVPAGGEDHACSRTSW